MLDEPPENWFRRARNGAAVMSDIEISMAAADAGNAEQALVLRLRAAFEGGDLVRSGRLLPERELAEALGVGRHSLRQALARLEAEGVIWRRQGHGTFISAVHPRQTVQFLEIASDTSPADMMEVRLELEPILARLCALRASRDQIERLRQAAIHAAEADSVSTFESSDFAFHRAVAEGANNILFLANFELVTAVLRQADWRVARQSTFSHSRRSEVFHQHDDIVQAVTARDPMAAETAMRVHLTSVYEYLQNRR
jgi:GntR family transcriptional repressor for pyruvate dehydrogenase complex